MNIFDVIGPVMIGPSSSHTAGAARIGNVARKLLAEDPRRAEILLHGSFAETYRGHGSDRAMIGGILGLLPSDSLLKDSFQLAKKQHLVFEFAPSDLGDVHPNTCKILLYGDHKSISVTASSVGGGQIQVVEINGAQVDFSAEYNTTIIFNRDRAGTVADVTRILSDSHVNIAFMRLFREFEVEDAIMILETDEPVCESTLKLLRQTPNVCEVIFLEPFTQG